MTACWILYSSDNRVGIKTGSWIPRLDNDSKAADSLEIDEVESGEQESLIMLDKCRGVCHDLLPRRAWSYHWASVPVIHEYAGHGRVARKEWRTFWFSRPVSIFFFAIFISLRREASRAIGCVSTAGRQCMSLRSMLVGLEQKRRPDLYICTHASRWPR